MLEVLVVMMLLGLVPAAIAKSKGRSFATWWVYGGLLFIVALPHAIFARAPDVAVCPICKEEVKPDALKCRHCGEDFGGPLNERRVEPVA